MNSVFSITVTFNADLGLLDSQVESLKDQVQGIIIVDNGSSNYNELTTYVADKRKMLDVKLIFVSNDRNMGLGYAQNRGIKEAISQKATDVLLLDQDSVLKGGFIENMYLTRKLLNDAGQKVGALGPIYYNESTGVPYPVTKFVGPFIKNQPIKEAPLEASFLIASGCFINMEVLKDVGLMNEQLFIDYVDVEWSFRAQSKNYKLYVSPNSTMTHVVGEKKITIAGRAVASHSPLRRYYLFRNGIFMVRDKNIPIGYKIREIAFNSLRLLLYITISKDRLSFMKYSYNGFKDGIRGIGGEYTKR